MKFLILFIVWSPLTLQAATTEITGKVVFKGKAPKKEVLRMNSDPVCVSQNKGGPIYKEDVQVNANGTLANVVVFVKEGAKPVPADNLPPVTFEQKGCHYTPHAVALRVNQPLRVVNDDPTMHNVHWKPKQNAESNFGQVGVGQTDTKKFAKPEVGIRIRCDVHGWMTAFVSVFDHPYFAITDEKGNFTIKDLPPGEYTLEAWQEKLGEKDQKVTLMDSGGKKTVDFTFN